MLLNKLSLRRTIYYYIKRGIMSSLSVNITYVIIGSHGHLITHNAKEIIPENQQQDTQY